MSKLMTAAQVAEQVHDGDFLCSSGVQLITVAEELLKALENRFLETGSPKNLTFMNGGGQGVPGVLDLGLTHVAHKGMIKRYIASHFSSNKAMMELAANNEIEIYNMPQGVTAHMHRAAAAGKKGELTKVGLKTFIDPRQCGGKLNDVTTEDIVHLVNVQGEEYLFYDAPQVNVAFIRGTTADEYGNISMEEECATIDSQDIALGCKANGGKVFVQVKNYVAGGSIPAKDVVISGNLVDGIVITTDVERYHKQTPEYMYNPVFAGYKKAPIAQTKPIPLNERKVIARRAAMELTKDDVVNLGYGIPECVANVLREEGRAEEITLSVETGCFGGVPVGGLSFGSSINHWTAFPMATQFDFYNAGGLSISCLGFAQIDQTFNVNASKVGKILMGCGGFIDIAQFTPKMVFCGTLTASGLKIAIEDGKLNILQEGAKHKLVSAVDLITFSGEYAHETNQKIMLVTERAVFQMRNGKLELIEIAPGVDLEKDVLAQMDFRPEVSADLKLMDERIFRPEAMGLFLK